MADVRVVAHRIANSQVFESSHESIAEIIVNICVHDKTLRGDTRLLIIDGPGGDSRIDHNIVVVFRPSGRRLRVVS